MLTLSRNRGALYVIAAVLSIVLSCWADLRATVINPDGICYLQSAATLSQGLTAATHVCEQAIWPFYSILIFGLGKITGLSMLAAAFVLNGIFSLITVLLFIAITELLSSSWRVCCLGAIVILLANQFNGVRAEIVRDHGFWAFYLTSVYFLLRYFRYFASPLMRKGGMTLALLWSSSLMIATLFRVEGAMFLLFLPLVALFDSRRKSYARIKSFLQLNSLTIAAGIGLIVWMTLHAVHSTGRLYEVQFQITHGLQTLAANFQATAALLAQHVLSVYATHDASTVLLVMLISWYLVYVITSVSLPYAVLIGYAWVKRLSRFDVAARLTVWSYIIVNVLVTAVFLADHMFLAKRYLIALALVLMLWVPCALDNLIYLWPKRKWPLVLAGLFIFGYALGGIFNFGYSKQYIRAAGDWLHVNAPQNAKIYSNDYQVLYYSQHFGNAIFVKGKEYADLQTIAQDKWRQFDYLALRTNKKDSVQNESVLQAIQLTPVAVFQNKRADQVRIYKVVH